MATLATPAGEVGWRAEDFVLEDAYGNPFRFYDLKGQSGTLVMFICNQCPYVRAVVGRGASHKLPSARSHRRWRRTGRLPPDHPSGRPPAEEQNDLHGGHDDIGRGQQIRPDFARGEAAQYEPARARQQQRMPDRELQ